MAILSRPQCVKVLYYSPENIFWVMGWLAAVACVLVGYFLLALGWFQFNFRKVIFKLTLVNGGWGISYEIALKWMPQDLAYDKSTLVQVMVWCRQATSHYLSQLWPRSMSPNGVTRPKWVKYILRSRGSKYVYLCNMIVVPNANRLT